METAKPGLISITVIACNLLDFEECRQSFIRSHNETLSVAVCIYNEDRPLESIAETQRQLLPALLRLSAIISQYFTYEREMLGLICLALPRHAVPCSAPTDCVTPCDR
jgi:hypothetical protein